MARLVQRMAIKTVVNKLSKQTQNKFWISGAKFDKWSTGDDQEIMVKFCVPQEVEIELNEKGRWGGDNSVDRLTIKEFKTENGEIKTDLKGWQLNDYGVKFFKDKEHAEKYFLEKSTKLIKYFNPIFDLQKELHHEMKHRDPYFLMELEA